MQVVCTFGDGAKQVAADSLHALLQDRLVVPSVTCDVLQDLSHDLLLLVDERQFDLVGRVEVTLHVAQTQLAQQQRVAVFDADHFAQLVQLALPQLELGCTQRACVCVAVGMLLCAVVCGAICGCWN